MTSNNPKLTVEDIIARLRQRGESKAAIARRLGVSETFVYRRLPRRPPEPPLPRDPRAANAVRAARGARAQLEALHREEVSE